LIPLAHVGSPGTSPPLFTTDAHTIAPLSPINSLFDFPVVQGVILKRIPKACRSLASSVFELCLRDVIDAPVDLNSWSRLLGFASCLCRPSRKGKRYNMSSQILASLSAYNDKKALIQASGLSNSYVKPRRGRPGPPVDADKDIARRASVKLGDVDVWGAVCLFRSDDSRSLVDSATLELLRLKRYFYRWPIKRLYMLVYSGVPR